MTVVRVPFTPFASLSFLFFGALLVLIGSTQDTLALSLGLDLAQTGLLGSSMLLGIGLGVLAGGPLVDRFPRRPLFCASALVTAAALVTVGPGLGFERAVAHAFFAGLGGGLYETVLNTATIERFQERSVRTVTLLHSSATIGAMLTPLAIGALTTSTSHTASGTWTLAFRMTGVAHLLLAVLGGLTPLGDPVRVSSTPEGPVGRPVLTPGLVGLCVAAFAYIGVESALTVFSIPYATEALGLPAERGRSAISLFWFGLLVGRLAFAIRSGADARIAAVAGGAAGIAWGAGVYLGWTQIEALTAIAGFALGGVFPLLVALAGQRTPHAPGSAVGVVAGLGSFGGFAIPWLTGVVGNGVGITGAAFALALWCALLGAAAWWSESLYRRPIRA